MNMKSLLFTCVVNLFAIGSYGQDSTAYELQRNKINALLVERSAKFGQYDQSLNTKTGIFGLQAKRDIRNSNEILRQIALTDNNIFTELKVLLDYKDIQFQQVKTDVNNNQVRIDSYKKTIRDLQVKNEELLIFNKKAEQKADYLALLTILFAVIIVALGYIITKKNKTIKSNEPIKEIKVL